MIVNRAGSNNPAGPAVHKPKPEKARAQLLAKPDTRKLCKLYFLSIYSASDIRAGKPKLAKPEPDPVLISKPEPDPVLISKPEPENSYSILALGNGFNTLIIIFPQLYIILILRKN